MTGPISRNRLLGSLKEAASWPGTDRNTVVTLATTLVTACADEEGSRYLQDLPQYFRGLALADLLPGAGPSEAGPAAADTGRTPSSPPLPPWPARAT